MENVYLSTLKVELRIRTFASSDKYIQVKYILGINWNQQKTNVIKWISNYSGRHTSTSRTSFLLFLISPSVSFSALSLSSYPVENQIKIFFKSQKCVPNQVKQKYRQERASLLFFYIFNKVKFITWQDLLLSPFSYLEKLNDRERLQLRSRNKKSVNITQKEQRRNLF